MTVQCAQMNLDGGLNDGWGGGWPVGDWDCGHQYGACPSGRVRLDTPLQEFSRISAGCSSNPSAAYWMNVIEGTRIELPVSGQWVSLSAATGNDGTSESTGHYYICP